MSLNCALAKKGYGEMGLSGSIAGPLFNIMIGFSLSAIKKLIGNNKSEISIGIDKRETIVLSIVIIFIILNSIRILLQVFFNKFRLNK